VTRVSGGETGEIETQKGDAGAARASAEDMSPVRGCDAGPTRLLRRFGAAATRAKA